MVWIVARIAQLRQPLLILESIRDSLLLSSNCASHMLSPVHLKKKNQ